MIQCQFITLTSGNSAEHKRAKKAAEIFENVTIINLECVSGATEILVMFAVRLESQNLPVEKTDKPALDEYLMQSGSERMQLF